MVGLGRREGNPAQDRRRELQASERQSGKALRRTHQETLQDIDDAFGPEGLDEYVELQTVIAKGQMPPL